MKRVIIQYFHDILQSYECIEAKKGKNNRCNEHLKVSLSRHESDTNTITIRSIWMFQALCSKFLVVIAHIHMQ